MDTIGESTSPHTKILLKNPSKFPYGVYSLDSLLEGILLKKFDGKI